MTPPEEFPYRAENGPRRISTRARGVEVELRNLPLPVRSGPREAVLVHAHATNAERRISAKTADRDLLILCIVIAIPRQEAGNACDVIREIHTESVGTQLRAGDGADGRGNVEGRHRQACGRHRHYVEVAARAGCAVSEYPARTTARCNVAPRRRAFPPTPSAATAARPATKAASTHTSPLNRLASNDILATTPACS